MFASSQPPAEGLLDLHCHLLPGIDDGCRNLTESLECITRWHEAGFRGAVCTPHLCTTFFPENTTRAVAEWIVALQHAVDEASLSFTLWPGGELRLAERTIPWLEEHGVPTLGPGKAVLIDWWGNDWPTCCDDAIAWLLERGYQPVLAHPERMGLPEAELDRVLACLSGQGVLLQGNLNSLAGGEGPAAQQRAEHLLETERYYVLASDTHRPESVPGRHAGLKRLRSRFGDDWLQTLLADRPRTLLHWGSSDN